jgi:hypothetical protein
MLTRIALMATVVVHYAVLVCVAATVIWAFASLPIFVAIWFLAITAMLVTTRTECPLTLLENRLRRKLGMKRCRGFVVEYIWEPLTGLFSAR